MYIALFASTIQSKYPYQLKLKDAILETKELHPYCSELLNGECFILPQFYILGYSKDNLMAYIIKKALDAEDDGIEYQFVIQDLKTNHKIINHLYRYDTVAFSADKEIVEEKIVDMNSNKILHKKVYKIKEFDNSFDFFWKREKDNIFDILKKYAIQRVKADIKRFENSKLWDLNLIKTTHKNLFPGENFIKDIKLYQCKNEIFHKHYKQYIYMAHILKAITHPYTQTPILILGSVQRGATGEPHFVILDIVGGDKHLTGCK
jgi:hypothetical protein